jgi:hypothetical protein
MPAITPTYGWPYQTLTDPPHGPDLGEDLALAIEATLTAIDARVAITDLLAASWTSRVPAWTSDGVAPSIGDGTISAKYTHAGKLLIETGSISMGSTTTFGTSSYNLDTPFTLQGVDMLGVCLFFDASNSANHRGGAVRKNGNNLMRAYGDGQWGATLPFTWAVGDRFSYVIASETS